MDPAKVEVADLMTNWNPLIKISLRIFEQICHGQVLDWPFGEGNCC